MCAVHLVIRDRDLHNSSSAIVLTGFASHSETVRMYLSITFAFLATCHLVSILGSPFYHHFSNLCVHTLRLENGEWPQEAGGAWAFGARGSARALTGVLVAIDHSWIYILLHSPASPFSLISCFTYIRFLIAFTLCTFHSTLLVVLCSTQFDYRSQSTVMLAVDIGFLSAEHELASHSRSESLLAASRLSSSPVPWSPRSILLARQNQRYGFESADKAASCCPCIHFCHANQSA